ncbi:DUF3883 domain-containing protein [Maribacter ulvicola]|uniref:Protein NO VEIN C-terminal domain-containing protein n=1 Tax=Maribacter ulvicola TaxID=228959 RepID=A0A1N6WS84_9FLAO|nr:DUF3883 domain-containing protein [Maribacter ulvicola]SIQ92882.1 protein of unknown function [Maribacter ulvicola]
MQDLLITPIDNSAIKDLIKLRRKEYLQAPLRIVEDYNNENKNIEEYNGRQLLEMIQNANDESDTRKAKKVFIKVDENSLIIANNGNPFSLGGVESLMYSDLSPKTMEENKVGKKGLGFRSILNWSKEIYIASYDLHLKFSQQHAKAFLHDLLTENPEIKKTLERKTKTKIPISVLRCPYFENDTSKKKEKEFDTVIELTLKEDVYDDILEQIEVDIVPEILLFLNKLEELEVQTPTEHFIISKVVLSNNKIRLLRTDLLEEESNEWVWNILEDKGTIEGTEETKNYELKIAYNPNEDVRFNKLFSYFRTEVDFPYPVIAHGSFELKSDRNHLARDKNDFNIQLIKKLAKLLVDCALKLTESEESNYDALRLLIPKEYKHSSLFESPWDFNDLIKDSINKAAIFPTINNTYITLDDEPIFYAIKIDHLIPETYYSDFKGFLKSTSDKAIVNYLWQEQGELNYYQEEFTARINKIVDEDGFTIDQKVEWVSILSEHTKHFYFKEDSVLPNLLINTKGEVIKTGKEEMILPPKGEIYDLPKELELQFLDKDFTELLKTQISGDIRDLSTRLRVFGVDEYSMTVVARKVISASHKLAKNESSDKKAIIGSMHKVLFHIYDGLKDDFNKTSFFQGLPSPLLFTRNGKLVSANSLYFGKEYDAGYLCHKLLKSVKNSKDLFVGSLVINSLETFVEEHSHSKIEKYLKWIGVADQPRKVVLENNNIPNKFEFVHHVFDSLKYPYSLPDDHKVFETNQVIKTTYGHDLKVLWYDNFDSIVKNTDIEYLLAWFLVDKDLYQSIVRDLDFDKAEFWFLFDQVRKHRYIEDSDIKSYILFYLKSQKFIPVDDGLKVKPIECVDNSGNLSPLVHSPQINYEAEVFDYYNIQTDQIELILNRLGVKESFKDLSIDVMYGFLNEHHRYFDKKSSSASVLYNSIIDATQNLPKNFNWDIEKRDYYLENGYVLCEVDGKNEYVRVKEATYVLNPNHSQDLLSKLKVSKVRQRVGNTRIKDLFGIEPIDYIEFEVVKPEFNKELNEQFSQELEELKPLFFIYRYQKNLKKKQKDRELGDLKSLKVKLCKSSTVHFELNGKKQSLNLKQNEYVYEKKSKTYYIHVSSTIRSYQDLKHDYRFTETLADIVCGAIAVTENRKDFMLIIGQRHSKWKEILTREFSNFHELENEVLKNFKGALSVKEQFWRGVLKACRLEFKNIELQDEKEIYKLIGDRIKWDVFFDIYRKINYNQIEGYENYEPIKQLFSSLGIDLINFNRYSKFKLDFYEFYLNKIYNLHIIGCKKYQAKLYSKGFHKSYSGDIEEFNSVDLSLIEIDESLFVDLNELYSKFIIEVFDLSGFDISTETSLDVEKIYRDNLVKLKNALKKENIYNADFFLSKQYDNQFKNKVYFGMLDDAFSDYKSSYLDEEKERRTVKLSEESIEIDIADDQTLIEEIEKNIEELDLEIDFYNPEKTEKSSKRKNNKKPRQSNNNNGRSAIPNSDIGFIGEKYAFELLKKEYDKVYWKSENAIRAGFSGGKDGYGYDFECVKNGVSRYVEVKSTTTSQKGFYISNNEVLTGHLNKDNYDILLITNLLDANKEFKYLKSIFKYSENDTFFDNNSFLVEADGYKIKFK